jgi:hypothetical protein
MKSTPLVVVREYLDHIDIKVMQHCAHMAPAI